MRSCHHVAVSAASSAADPNSPTMLSIKTSGAPLMAIAVIRLRASSSSRGFDMINASRPLAILAATAASKPLPVPGMFASIRNSGAGPVKAWRENVVGKSASYAAL